MLVSYVDRCAVCACSSLRDEGGRRPVPGLTSCASGCPCHDTVPASGVRSARASAAAMSNDAVRFRLFRRARRAAVSAGHPAASR
ncbi:MAG: hypothetical protein JWO60_1307 [Frankiales bacterium]|nr:hypothetical protein [Frankiales bacterium]